MRAGDGNANIAFPSDTAGNVCTAGGNPTIGNGQRIAGRGLARSRFGDDGDVPKPVIGRLSESRCCCNGNRRGEHRANKDSTDAIKAHGIISPMCVIGPLIDAQCVQNLLRCGKQIRSTESQINSTGLSSLYPAQIQLCFAIKVTPQLAGEHITPEGPEHWWRIARPAAWRAGFCASLRSRLPRRAAFGPAEPARAPTVRVPSRLS